MNFYFRHCIFGQKRSEQEWVCSWLPAHCESTKNKKKKKRVTTIDNLICLLSSVSTQTKNVFQGARKIRRREWEREKNHGEINNFLKLLADLCFIFETENFLSLALGCRAWATNQPTIYLYYMYICVGNWKFMLWSWLDGAPNVEFLYCSSLRRFLVLLSFF